MAIVASPLLAIDPFTDAFVTPLPKFEQAVWKVQVLFIGVDPLPNWIPFVESKATYVAESYVQAIPPLVNVPPAFTRSPDANVTVYVALVALTGLASFNPANPPITTAAMARLSPPPRTANNVFFFITITPD